MLPPDQMKTPSGGADGVNGRKAGGLGTKHAMHGANSVRDAILEFHIGLATRREMTNENWRYLVGLIKQRSPDQIRRMERLKGLDDGSV